jgi:hypothetical protein
MKQQPFSIYCEKFPLACLPQAGASQDERSEVRIPSQA